MARSKKEKVKRRKAVKSENRVFKKLSQAFASKLGVKEESSAAAIASKNPRAVNKNTVLSSRFRRKETKKPGATTTPTQKGDREFDLEYAGLLEREQAASMQRRKSASKQHRAAIRGSTRKQKRRNNNHKMNHNEDAANTPVADGQLDFQPATFSLTKSTNELVTEATTRLHNVGLCNTSISNTPPSSIGSLSSQFQLQRLPEWNSNNPDHRLQAPTKNRFSMLTRDDDDADSSTEGKNVTPSLAFQPATFALIPSQNHTPKEIDRFEVDPDL
jgi:hypothetical protein